MNKMLQTRMIAAVAAVALVLNLASCSEVPEMPGVVSLYGEGANVTDVTVTYECSVPEELHGYVDIYPCVNNDVATDMLPTHARTLLCSQQGVAETVLQYRYHDDANQSRHTLHIS